MRPLPVSGRESEAPRARPWAGAPDHVRADVPEWIAAHLPESLGTDWVAEARALAMRPPLDLRVNTLKSVRERVLKALARFRPEAGALPPEGIRIAPGERDSRTPNVQGEEAFLKGWFEVQDFGSQIAAALVGARPGEQVLDLCAGAGGKTLAIAAAMENRGQIFAHDSDRQRLAPIYDRLKRAGVRNVQVRPPGEGVLDDLAGRMDRVAVDAPCTGSGTWRRRPDAKWRLTPDQLAARIAEQRAILADAARYVKPGGTLVYITCSVLPDENGCQVSAFLAPSRLRRRARIGPLARPLRRRRPRAVHAGRRPAADPATTGTDGFYIAAMRRGG